MEGSITRELKDCAGCLNHIGKDEYVTALGQDWHRDCFRCSACDSLLSTWYFEKAGLLFCQADYWARFGEICQQCAQVITGPVMSAGRLRFHPECFSCARCGAPIEDAEPYALLHTTTIYCVACYRSHGVCARAGHGALARAHDGHLVIDKVDMPCSLLSLHIGDRVLEINGAPVHQSSDLQRSLASPDALLQLTIEHNPSNPAARPAPEGSPERRVLREDNTNIPTHNNEDSKDSTEGAKCPVRERLFKRKVCGAGAGGARVVRRRQTAVLADRDRSTSMSQLGDQVDERESGECPRGVLSDLARARSFRDHQPPAQKVFRASDLIQGELLGSGFFGQVYKVTQRETGEVMVLKQLYRIDEDAQRNFLKEVAVLRSLNHPNVLRFVGVLYKEKRLHLVTEYVAGGTLHHLLQECNIPLSWGERACLARDVSRGTGYLHRMNVIHRDLNSHNCLVREDKTVIVADFGLARIVQRTASSAHERHSLRRRKRYTVVGNPYWMAPEMMNGLVYDEKVDVFSFGIILCEIIGRVSADPDFMPRQADFGLNESAFVDKFCRDPPCPEAFYRIAFQACQLDPDKRPPFEVLEIWLSSLVCELSGAGAGWGASARVLADVVQFARARGGAPALAPHITRSPTQLVCEQDTDETEKSQSSSHFPSVSRALAKCVSAGALSACARPRPPRLSRSERALAPGYILSTVGHNIKITKVSDITAWLDPPLLKHTSPESSSPESRGDSAADCDAALPAFLRNQSVEGLETEYKHEVEQPIPICRHISIPDHCQMQKRLPDPPANESDSSDSEHDDMCRWYRNVTNYKKIDKMDVDQPKNLLANIVKKGENLISKKSSYDVTDVTLRHPELKGERKIPEVDSRRFNIDNLTKNRIMAEGVRNLTIPKIKDEPKEKSNFFTKKLLSPKLSRLFKPSESNEEKDDKSRSKFFVQSPSYRVRPSEHDESRVISADLKLASMGKPMTPIFRRHIPGDKHNVDGRFSYRDRRPKYDFKSQEPKFIEVGRNRIKTPINSVDKKLAPLIRTTHTTNIPALNTQEKKYEKEKKKREPAISRSNYVSLANLKINSKRDAEPVSDDTRKKMNQNSPVERVI